MLHISKQLISFIWDLFHSPDPEQILAGKKMFRPFMQYQNAWLAYFHPDDTINDNTNVWAYLQKYMLPLIKQHASSYHLQGIHDLNLDAENKPSFNEFKHLFAEVSNGFQIEPVNKELHPIEYFSLIRQKKFPCIEKIRSPEELFCANEPDFWHEAIGHIAPLCYPEVQEFYLDIAEYMLSAQSKATFEKRLSIAWTLTEYGFIKENGINKMFGAALVGSHLANKRYLNGLIHVEPAKSSTIIDSGFYPEKSPLARDGDGKLRFFCLDHLKANSIFDF